MLASYGMECTQTSGGYGTSSRRYPRTWTSMPPRVETGYAGVTLTTIGSHESGAHPLQSHTRGPGG